MADWSGEFGKEYTIRNAEIADRTAFFKFLTEYDIETAFEIGCNIGSNLKVLGRLGIEAMGCDVNAYAAEIAVFNGLQVYVADGMDLKSDNYDLVFTVGVLIHLQTPELIEMMRAMVRGSCRYVLFAEYRGKDEEVFYRGQRGALIKREFGRIFEAMFPDAILMETGAAGKEQGFDDITYWMYDISNCASADRITPTSRKSFEASEETEFISVPFGAIREGGVS